LAEVKVDLVGRKKSLLVPLVSYKLDNNEGK